MALSAISGDAGTYGKPEVHSVLRFLTTAVLRSQTQYRPGEDFLLHVQVVISGGVWQHGRSGVRLGNISRKSRSLVLRIYLPDEVTTPDQAAQYLAGALTAAAGLVHSRLRRRAPDWPADDLAAELAALAGVIRK